MQTKVGYEASGGIAVLTLTNPPANTYGYEMMRELDEAILRARFDATVHVIVLRGAGDKFFCAGADIKMLQGADPAFKYNFCLHANETLNRLEQTAKLVIVYGIRRLRTPQAGGRSNAAAGPCISRNRGRRIRFPTPGRVPSRDRRSRDCFQ